MKKIIIATALATMMSTAAFAQFNQNAPQPSSDGRGVNVPATSATGTAIDRPDSNQMQEDARMRRRDSGDGMTTGMSNGGTSNGSMSGGSMSNGGTSNGGMSR